MVAGGAGGVAWSLFECHHLLGVAIDPNRMFPANICASGPRSPSPLERLDRKPLYRFRKAPFFLGASDSERW